MLIYIWVLILAYMNVQVVNLKLKIWLASHVILVVKLVLDHPPPNVYLAQQINSSIITNVYQYAKMECLEILKIKYANNVIKLALFAKMEQILIAKVVLMALL